MPAVAVILRSYNEAHLIQRCLEAVLQQRFDDFEVILVDSGSTDRTLEIARRYERVRIVPIAKADFTYGRALNVGMRAAAADSRIGVFLSAHAIPATPHWLDALTAPLFADEQVAGCYGKQTPLPEHLSNRVVAHLARHGYPQCYGETAFVTKTSHFFSNSNAAVRRGCWVANPYDETLPYSEDWFWAKQMIAAGHSIAYAPGACVLHSHPDSLGQFLRRRRSEERGFIAVEGAQARRMSARDYLSGLAALLRAAVRRSHSATLSHGEGFDFFLVEAVSRTAAFLERRKLPSVSARP
jgi:rhamnosyltransferase